MNNKYKPYVVQKVQNEQMAEWETVLKPEAYARVKKVIDAATKDYTEKELDTPIAIDSIQIPRGTDIDQVVASLRSGSKYTYINGRTYPL